MCPGCQSFDSGPRHLPPPRRSAPQARAPSSRSRGSRAPERKAEALGSDQGVSQTARLLIRRPNLQHARDQGLTACESSKQTNGEQANEWGRGEKIAKNGARAARQIAGGSHFYAPPSLRQRSATCVPPASVGASAIPMRFYHAAFKLACMHAPFKAEHAPCHPSPVPRQT